MRRAKYFTVLPYSLDIDASTATFPFRVDFMDDTSRVFQEVLRVPATRAQWETLPEALRARLLESLSLALGVSYFKMHLPPYIVIDGFSLTREQADFLNTLYTKGLGEFFYRNQIDFRGLVSFPAEAVESPAPAPVPRTQRCMVALGGGKDSIVSVELLREAGKEFSLFSLGTTALQEHIAGEIGRPLLVVERTLDAEMVRLSREGEVYNGHIPISAIYLFAGLLLCALRDYRYLVFSNEASADVGNVEYLGEDINHQWSKSAEFERLARAYIRRYITDDIEAFSLLRPLQEIEVVRRFARYPAYFPLFSSCNRNFRAEAPESRRQGHAYWCGTCPKCAFVFSCLTAFLPKETAVDIVGKNLYADLALTPLYRELLGIEAFKPFECVGTPEEVAVAISRAEAGQAYAGEAVLELFEKLRPALGTTADMERRVLAVGNTSTLPEAFRSVIGL